MERGKEREEAWSFDGVAESKRTTAKGSEENKENLVVNSELKDDLLVYQDEEALNDSIISGEESPEPAGCGAPWRRCSPRVVRRRDRARACTSEDEQGCLPTGPGLGLGDAE